MKNQAIQFNGQIVLTTKYLANLLEVTPSVITSITNGSYKKNKIFSDKQFDILTEGVDYILLNGSDRLTFVDNNRNAYLDISHRGSKFRIFTKSGVVKMSRNLKRLNLYYKRIYEYFSGNDLTFFYEKNERYFLSYKDSKEKKFVSTYKDNSIQLQLDQMNKRLEEVSDKVDNQRAEISIRLAVLEERIDSILLSKLGIKH